MHSESSSQHKGRKSEHTVRPAEVLGQSPGPAAAAGAAEAEEADCIAIRSTINGNKLRAERLGYEKYNISPDGDGGGDGDADDGDGDADDGGGGDDDAGGDECDGDDADGWQ